MAQLVVQYLGLMYSLVLRAIIHHVCLLTRHGIVDSVYAGHARNWRDDGLHAVLKLLVIVAIVWCHR